MKSRFFVALMATAIAVAANAGCSGGSGGDDLGNIPDFIIVNDTAHNDTATDPGKDAAEDTATPDESPVDTRDTVGDDAVDTAMPDTNPVDEGGHDQGTDEGTDIPDDPDVPLFNFCNSLNDCQPYEVCDLSLGRCEERTSYKIIVGNEGLLEYRPPEGGPGDFIVLDGKRFITSPQGAARADIDKELIAGATVAHSQIGFHRIFGPVKTKGGPVGVVFQQASPIYQKYPDSFSFKGASGVIDCDGTTPTGTGTKGALGDVGPYAAGYVDFVDDDIRIYYPAECGSIRRPAVPGTYPIMTIVAESADLSFPFINFDYIGQMLATWGIVTASVRADTNTEDATAAPKRLVSLVPGLISADLSSRHPALTGVSTSDQFAWMIVGSGIDVMGQISSNDPDNLLKNKAKAAVAIAPSAAVADMNVPTFLSFFATNDGVANTGFAQDSYENNGSPKWLVEVKGGNHSMFSDHAMYYGGGYMPIVDGDPEIMRKDQMYLTISVLLPFLQKAFGMEEPFSGQLQTSFNNDKIRVTKG